MAGRRGVLARATVLDARDQFSEALQRAAQDKERVVIRRRRKPVAALVPLKDLRLLEKIEEHLDLKDFRAARRAAKRESFKALEEVLRKLGIKAYIVSLCLTRYRSHRARNANSLTYEFVKFFSASLSS